MKFYTCNPNASTGVDGTLQSQILRHFPQAPTEHHADVTLVPVVYHPNFVFSQELNTLKKPVVLLDYTEYGWDWSGTENRLGYNCCMRYQHLDQEGYHDLDEWASKTKFLVHFKRELLRKDVSENLLPCEFTCCHEKAEIQEKNTFLTRQIEVLHHWGFSHPLRQKLHGEIFSKASEFGYNVMDSRDDRVEARNWATFYAPHYRRWPQYEVQEWYRESKISVSLPGAGIKCFRHAEAPNESVMALPYDDLAWSYPWIPGYNCVRIRGDAMVEDMQAQLNSPLALYNTYLAGQETIDLYRSENYVKNYLIQNIKDRL